MNPRDYGFNADRIVEGIYVGADTKKEDLVKLQRLGFRPPVTVAAELGGEFPLEDSILTSSQLATAQAAAQYVIGLRKQGGRVLVTCHMGINRSCFVVALALVQLERISGAQAMELVRRFRRPMFRGEVIQVLTNSHYANYLNGLK